MMSDAHHASSVLRYVLEADAAETAAIHHQTRRYASLLARGLLRYLYQEIFHDTQLLQLQICKSAAGQPSLYDNLKGIYVNASISHSRDVIAVAIDGQGEIGIDVEYCRHERDWQTIAARTFPSAINMRLEMAEEFYQAWCIYEAWGKANDLQHIYADKNTGLMQLIGEWLCDRAKYDHQKSPLTLFAPADNYSGCVYRIAQRD